MLLLLLTYAVWCYVMRRWSCTRLAVGFEAGAKLWGVT